MTEMSETAHIISPAGSSREQIVAEIGVMALIGLAVALIGPFETATMPLAVRFAYWIGGFLIGWAGFRLTAKLTMAAARLLGLPAEAGYALAVPLLAVPIMMAVSWSFGSGAGSGGSLILYWQIVAIGAGFYVLFAWIYGRANAKEAGDYAPSEPANAPHVQGGIPASALHADLPPGFGAIAALAVEDHYVTVHSADGAREMLLVNLADAIQRVDPKNGGENGMRTHRSWWVAASAVTGHRRDGRNMLLLLESGLEVPLSRANVAKARDRGWL